jgi:hypothetical protein
MMLELFRDNEPSQAHNWGELFIDGRLLGQTLEDPDRRLEDGGEKIHGQSAIPRGRYKVTVTFSNRFQKLMPLVHDVPGFEGVRIHGGNTEANTDGCPLLGQRRTAVGVADCAGVNARLINYLVAAADRGEDVWLEVK